MTKIHPCYFLYYLIFSHFIHLTISSTTDFDESIGYFNPRQLAAGSAGFFSLRLSVENQTRLVSLITLAESHQA